MAKEQSISLGLPLAKTYSALLSLSDYINIYICLSLGDVGMWPALRHPWFPFLLHRTSQIPIPKTHAFITSTNTIVSLRPDKIKVTIVHPYFVGQVKWFPDISARTCLNMKTTAII